MVVHTDACKIEGFRNIKGLDTCNVRCLNITKLAPGGKLGRLVIWTEDAFNKLNSIYESKKTHGRQ